MRALIELICELIWFVSAFILEIAIGALFVFVIVVLLVFQPSLLDALFYPNRRDRSL